MVRFINRLTGGEMFVSEDRVEEYRAAGHKLAADLSEDAKAPAKAPAPKAKAAVKKPAEKAAGKKK